MTDLRRKQNRMNFGELQEDVIQDSIGFSLGQAKSGGAGGRLRAPQVDQKSRARMSKFLQKNLHKQTSSAAVTSGAGGATSVRSKQISGTASSVTFTPVQGLEIVNPQAVAVEKKAATQHNPKYFASTAAFLKVHTPIPGAPLPTGTNQNSD